MFSLGLIVFRIVSERSSETFSLRFLPTYLYLLPCVYLSVFSIYTPDTLFIFSRRLLRSFINNVYNSALSRWSAYLLYISNKKRSPKNLVKVKFIKSTDASINSVNWHLCKIGLICQLAFRRATAV